MSHKDKKISAKKMFNKIKELMTATEADDEEQQDTAEKTDAEKIDITNKEDVKAVQPPRLVMEEIFSTATEEIRTETTNPLDMDNTKKLKEDDKEIIVPSLHEVKLEEIETEEETEEIEEIDDGKPKLEVITPETIHSFIPQEERVELTNLDEFLKDAIKTFDDEDTESDTENTHKENTSFSEEKEEPEWVEKDNIQIAEESVLQTNEDKNDEKFVKDIIKNTVTKAKKDDSLNNNKSQIESETNATIFAKEDSEIKSNIDNTVVREESVLSKDKKVLEENINTESFVDDNTTATEIKHKDKSAKKHRAKKNTKTIGKHISSAMKNFAKLINDKPDEFLPDDLYSQNNPIKEEKLISKRPKEKNKTKNNTEKLQKETEKLKDKEEKEGNLDFSENSNNEKTEKLEHAIINKKNFAEKHEESKECIMQDLQGTEQKENKKIIEDNKDIQEKPKGEEKDKYLGDFERQFGKIKPMDKGERLYVNGVAVPAYIPEAEVAHINTLSERFSFTLRGEYEEYLKEDENAKKDDESSEVIKTMLSEDVSETEEYSENGPQREYKRKEKLEEIEESKEDNKKNVAEKRATIKFAKTKQSKVDKEPLNIKDKLFGSFEQQADYSVFTEPIAEDESAVINDYDTPADAKGVRAEINLKISGLIFKSIIIGIIFILLFLTVLGQKFFPQMLTNSIPNVDMVYCIINFLLLIFAGAICHETIKNGLKPLLNFKGNSDTVLAVATVITAIQGITTFFEANQFYEGIKNIYSLLVIFALLLNTIGKLWVMLRIRDNFKFITTPNKKYVAKIYDDTKTANKMLYGMKGEKPVVAFQRRTGFLKSFLKLSYTPDPSEKVAGKFAPFCVVSAVLIAIVYGIVNTSVTGAISAMSLVSCVCIPVCCLLAVNVPMRTLCKRVLKAEGMVVGYPAVKQFSNCNAIMLDSKALYPRGKVELESVRTFLSYKIDEALLSAAAVVKVANTSLTYLFEDIIRDRADSLPIVESVKYEDEKGLVAWVAGERMLLGNRELLQKYNIEPPSYDYEEKYSNGNRRITYLVNSGQLIAMFVINYRVDKRVSEELRRLEKNGVRFLIRTADPNITQEFIASDFKLYYRSVKILPTVLGNICKEETSEREESSRCYITTRGKMVSLSRALSGCIKIKNNISLAIVIQFMAIVLGLILVAAVVISSGLESLGTLELFLYTLLWALAAIIAPSIQKP